MIQFTFGPSPATCKKENAVPFYEGVKAQSQDVRPPLVFQLATIGAVKF